MFDFAFMSWLLWKALPWTLGCMRKELFLEHSHPHIDRAFAPKLNLRSCLQGIYQGRPEFQGRSRGPPPSVGLCIHQTPSSELCQLKFPRHLQGTQSQPSPQQKGMMTKNVPLNYQRNPCWLAIFNPNTFSILYSFTLVIMKNSKHTKVDVRIMHPSIYPKPSFKSINSRILAQSCFPYDPTYYPNPQLFKNSQTLCYSIMKNLGMYHWKTKILFSNHDHSI